MNKNNVTKKEFNLAMTLIVIMFIILSFNGWSITNSIETLDNEITESIDRDLTNLGISAKNQTEALSLSEEANDSIRRDIKIREDMNKLQNVLVKANAEDIHQLELELIKLRAADASALKRDIGNIEAIELNQKTIIKLQKSVIELKNREIKDLELEILPQVQFKSQ